MRGGSVRSLDRLDRRLGHTPSFEVIVYLIIGHAVGVFVGA